MKKSAHKLSWYLARSMTWRCGFWSGDWTRASVCTGPGPYSSTAHISGPAWPTAHSWQHQVDGGFFLSFLLLTWSGRRWWSFSILTPLYMIRSVVVFFYPYSSLHDQVDGVFLSLLLTTWSGRRWFFVTFLLLTTWSGRRWFFSILLTPHYMIR